MNSRKLDRRAFLGLGVGILGVAVTPRWLRSGAAPRRLAVPVMGTTAELVVAGVGDDRAGFALRAGAAELHRVERLMTRFDPDSDVGRFNAAPIGARVPVSPETVQVVRRAVEWARLTDGAFDPTLGTLTPIWDPVRVSEPPRETAVRAAAADARGWEHLEWGGEGGDAWLLRTSGGALDLGAIAKGWAIDRTTDLLAGFGVESALVNVGGDLVALGAGPDGRPWRVGIRDPRDPDGVLRTLELEDAAMATSGDYLRWFEHDGLRYAHILDPTTAAPARGRVRSVTVSAPRAVEADAAATSAYLLGAAEARRRFARRSSEPRIVHFA